MSIQAMKLALEALENLQGGCTDSNDGTVEALTVWCPEVCEALREAIAAAEKAEPVAWRYQDARGNYRYCGYKSGFDTDYPLLKPIPLYTHPVPQRKPLTEPELRKLLGGTNHMISNAMCGPFWPELEEACRAIEAAHGIGEQK